MQDQWLPIALSREAQHAHAGALLQLCDTEHGKHFSIGGEKAAVWTCVKNWRPALPYMWRSPWKEPRQPVNEKKGSGTGMGTLMPTIPTCT